MSLGPGRPRDYIVDIDAEDGVDEEVKQEHLDAVHEDVVVELQLLRRFKVEPDAYRFIPGEGLGQIEDDGCGDQTCIHLLFARDVSRRHENRRGSRGDEKDHSENGGMPRALPEPLTKEYEAKLSQAESREVYEDYDPISVFE